MIVDLSGNIAAGPRREYECPVPPGTTKATVRVERIAWQSRAPRALRVEFSFVIDGRETATTFFETDSGEDIDPRTGQPLPASFLTVPVKGNPQTFRASIESRFPLDTRLTVDFT